jgi:hypothetical protein
MYHFIFTKFCSSVNYDYTYALRASLVLYVSRPTVFIKARNVYDINKVTFLLILLKDPILLSSFLIPVSYGGLYSVLTN